MNPALAQSPITQRNQSTHRNEASIAVLLVRLLLHKGADAGVFVVNEVDQILSHAMQTGRETLVLDAVQIDFGEGLLPRNGIPSTGQQ